MARDLTHAVVVGSSGFIGSYLVDQLVRQGVRVTGISRNQGKVQDSLQKATHWIPIDIVNAPPATYLPECDMIFFCAGIASVPASVEAPLADLDGNLRAPLRIMQALRERGGDTGFLYASSAAVYGSALHLPMSELHPLDPLSPYGASKLATETYVRLYATKFGVPGASARVFSVYGPGQDKQVIYDWSRKVALGGEEISFFGAPEVSRDFIHVADAARAFISIARNAPLGGESYNIASGIETSLGELAENLLAISGQKCEYKFSGKIRLGDPVRWQADITALKQLGFSPKVSFMDGLRETYQWANNQ